MQEYILYGPYGKSFEELLKKEGHSATYIKRHLWKYYFVFTLAVSNLEKTAWESEFVRVDMEKLTQQLGGESKIMGRWERYSKQIMDELCKWDVIIRQHTNPRLIPGAKKSTRTRVDIKLNDNCLAAGYSEWVCPADYNTCELREETCDYSHLSGIYLQMANNLSIIEFDAAAARAFAYQAYQNRMALPAKRIKNILYTDRCVNQKVYSHWLAAISRMERKSYRPVADNKAGKTDRFFCLLANLPRPLREFILVNGQKLEEVDISSSQCLIFAIYLKQHYATLGEPLPADVEHYIQLCKAGKFYQYAQSIVLAPGESMSYDLFKVTFFARIFFSNEQRQYQWRTRFAHEDNFPNVSRIITEFKSENYKDLPQKLSHLESEIMLHRITPRLFQEGITEQFSVHDSFFCTPVNKARIEQIVIEEFQKYGVTPHLKNKSVPVVKPVLSEAELFEQSLNVVHELGMFEELDLLAYQAPVESLGELEPIPTYSLKPDFSLLTDQEKIEQIERDLATQETREYQFDPFYHFHRLRCTLDRHVLAL
jgi:hypothetical protein